MESHLTAVEAGEAATCPPEPASNGDSEFWYSLIPEREAAKFLNLKVGTIQNWRQSGVGSRYVRLSARCIKYRRIDLKEWADEHLRRSTADHGEATP